MIYKLGYVTEPHPFPELVREYVLPEEMKLNGEEGWKPPKFYTHKVPPPVRLVVDTEEEWDLTMDAAKK